MATTDVKEISRHKKKPVIFTLFKLTRSLTLPRFGTVWICPPSADQHKQTALAPFPESRPVSPASTDLSAGNKFRVEVSLTKFCRRPV